MPSKTNKEDIRRRRQDRLSELISINRISAVTDADISDFRQRQLEELCAHFGLDARGTVKVLSRRLRDLRDGPPSTPPPEERKQPALLLPPTSPQTYAAVAAGAPAAAQEDSDVKTTASPRTIAAVHAVDTLESDSSLAVDNSFIEGDFQDLPGSATAPWKSQSSVNLQQVLASPLFTTHVSNIVQWELESTATSVHNVETAVRDNSNALASLVTTVHSLAKSVEILQDSMSTTQQTMSDMNSSLLKMVPRDTTRPDTASATASQGEAAVAGTETHTGGHSGGTTSDGVVSTGTVDETPATEVLDTGGDATDAAPTNTAAEVSDNSKHGGFLPP